MKKYLCALILSVVILIPASSFAEMESWYIYMGLGSSYTMYDGVLKDDLVDTNGMDQTYSFYYDLLHVYFPINNNLVLGPGLSILADIYEVNSIEVNIFQYFAGLSTMYFFGEEIGDGFFLRGEIGLSRLLITSDINSNVSGSNWGSGYGVNAGIGYSFPVTEGTRIALNVFYSYKYSEDEDDVALKSSSVNFTVGVLF